MTKMQSIALSVDGIQVSPLDQRQYKHLKLCNGLEALVISDPSTESASAAMDVHVGFHSDPSTLPGLAHFCEHMLFLGTEKYPDENSYTEFLTKHGGVSNAFTTARNTNYYFDVAATHFQEALDRFAQFFIAPLFTSSATEREMKAVDSEATNYLQDDDWRLNQLLRSLGNDAHPYHRYGVGNLTTLTPENVDVRQELLKFYDEYYSASIMKLVIYGKEDVGTLGQWVTTLFSGIKTTGRAPPSFETNVPYLPTQLGRRIDAKPVKDLKILSVSWVLRSLRRHLSMQHASVIAHFIGHEGAGSLLSYLKEKKWINSITAGVEEEFDEFALFVITMEATEDGIAHVNDVLEALFGFLALLKSTQLEKWVFDELEKIAIMHFLFQSKTKPIQYTSSIAMGMQTHPLRHFLSQGTLEYPFEPAQVHELLCLMTPTQMRLMVVCQSLETSAEEKWYGTKYHDAPLDPSLLGRLEALEAPSAFQLPPQNALVPDNFQLIGPVDQSIGLETAPSLLRDDAVCRIWFKPDLHFQLPRTHVSLTFYSPHIDASPYGFVLTDLFVQCLKDDLTEFAYDAALAGMHYDMALHKTSAIQLGVVGYSDKIHVLVQQIIDRMRQLPQHLSQKTFERVHQALCRQYENFRLDEAFHFALQEANYLLVDGVWRQEEMIPVVRHCTLSMLQRHIERLLRDQLFLEALVYGNLHEEDATALIQDEILSQLAVRPPVTLVSDKRQVQLTNGVHFMYHCEHPNPQNGNCVLDVIYQIGSEDDLKTRVVLGVFSLMVSDPFFNQMRTKEQLGYTVFSTPSRSNGIQLFRTIIQSNVARPEYMLQRLDAFWHDFYDTTLSPSNQAILTKYIDAVVKEYSEKPTSQEEEVRDWMVEILNQQYDFHRTKRLAELTKTVQWSDVCAFYETYIAPTSVHRQQLSVFVYAQDQSAMMKVTNHNAVDATVDEMMQTIPPSIVLIDDALAFRKRMPLYPIAPPSRPYQFMA